MAAMSETPRGGEGQSDREARVLKSVLEADIVPDNKIGKVRSPVGGGSARRKRRWGSRGGDSAQLWRFLRH